VLFVIAMLHNLTAPLLHVAVHERDPCFNLPLIVAEVEPLPLTLLDELGIRAALLLMPPHGTEDQDQLGISRMCGMKWCLFGLFPARPGMGRLARHPDKFRHQGIVLVRVEIDQHPLDKLVQEVLTGSEDGIVLILFRHDRLHRRQIAPNPLGQIHHVRGRLLRIGDHRQQMTSIQRGCIVIAHPGVGRQEEGIGQIHTPVVVADDTPPHAVNRLGGTVIQDAVEPRIEDELANQPAPIFREPLDIPVVAGKQFIVIDLVSELRLAQLVLQLRGIVLPQLTGNPSDQGRSLRLAGLTLFLLRRHLLEDQLLLRLIEQIKPGIERQVTQVVQADVPLLRAVFMTGEAVVLQNHFRVRVNTKSPILPDRKIADQAVHHQDRQLEVQSHHQFFSSSSSIPRLRF
jgi:hypothetical protein